MAKMVIITANSQDAKRIERKHNDPKTVRWIGSAKFEVEQIMRVDGHAEILLELAANREIDNVTIVREWDTSDIVASNDTDFEPNIEAMEAAQSEHKEIYGNDGGNILPDPEDDAQDIHIYYDGKYIFTTNLFAKRSSALKFYRDTPAYRDLKVTARVSNYYNDQAVKEETGTDFEICN